MKPTQISRRQFLITSAVASLAGIRSAMAEPESQAPMPHIVLLGDSVFDNAPYVASGHEVIEKLRYRLPTGWRATLLARDGAVMADAPRQIERLPEDATHLVVSAGGNDALGNLAGLDAPVSSIQEALGNLAGVRDAFQQQYRAMIDEVLGVDLPTAICTIYDARFPDPDLRRVANTGLAALNDIITREAAARGLPLIDLRVLFDDDADFANPIEPSSQGGEKLAGAIFQLVSEHDFAEPRSTVYATAL
jgi:lysophospholipase L1-like esterase